MATRYMSLGHVTVSNAKSIITRHFTTRHAMHLKITMMQFRKRNV